MVSAKHLLSIAFLAAVLLSLGSGVSLAQTHTWTGTVSTDWNDPANWDAGTVPGTSSSVKITNMPNKPVLSSSVTVASVQVGSWYPGAGETQLTVDSGGDLTITSSLSFISEGSLHIDGGDVELTYTGNTATNSNAKNFIEMTSGSFTTTGDFTVNGGDATNPGFSIGNGTVNINGNFTINSNKKVTAGDGDLYVGNDFTNSGNFTAGDLSITVDGALSSPGDFETGDLILSVDDDITVGNFSADNIDIDTNGSFTINSGKNFNVGNGDLDAGNNFSNSGNFTAGDVNMTVGGALSSPGDFETGDLILSADDDITVGNFSANNIDIYTNGSFTINSGKNFEIDDGSLDVTNNFSSNGNYSAASVNLSIGGKLTIANNQTFSIGSSEVIVQDTTKIFGTYNGNDGVTTFNSTATVGSGGVIDLDSGTLNFNDFTTISNNGTMYLGTGTANFGDDVTVQSSGFIYVESGEMNVTGDANFSNNGNLYVDDGSVNVTGNASLSSGGEMSFNSGSFSVGGDASFTNGGDVSLGDSDVEFSGNLTTDWGSNFDAGTSTVTFNGNGSQTINTSGNDITFYDVVVGQNTNLETDGSTENTVIIENSLTVENGGSVTVEEDDAIDIQGELDDEGGNVVSERPFVYSIATPSLTQVVVTFDKAMNTTTTGNASNYSINNGITVSSATPNPSNNKQVTLAVSSLTNGVEYELTVNNVESSTGAVISSNHIKRFTVVTQVVFYSRQTGDWNVNSTWSTVSHTGAAASSNPTTEDDAEIIIGNGHTVTVNSSATITDQQSVTVDASSTLLVGSGGTLELGTDVITGSGTFQVGSGTIEIGSSAGISASGSSGNIQTSNRSFGTSGSYTYNGSSAQSAGSGLPDEVNNLRIDNSAGVTLADDIEVTGTLYLTDGTLTIESGDNLIANDKSISGGNLTMERRITGSTGWRMISSPLSSSYGDLLDNTITQGYSGAYYSTGSNPGDTLQPNVMWYDETYHTNTQGLPATDNQRWRAPSSASSSIPDGRGLYVFFFGDINGDPLYDNIFDFPITLSVSGQENEGNVDFGVTYTTAADSGWNLVGNPYAATIDWDDASSWTKTNVDNTIYVWDAGSSSFRTWNGSTGNLPSQGLIAPFQGFWVKANGTSPELEVTENAKTFGGTYAGKARVQESNPPLISLSISAGDKEAATHFMFSEEAKINKDLMDAYRLLPPPGIGSYLDISSIASNGEHYAINNLPRKFGQPIEIPIYAEAFESGYSSSTEIDLQIDKLENIPSGWDISLIDHQTKAKISLNPSQLYKFKLNGVANKMAPNNTTDGKPKVAAKGQNRSPRFSLIIDPGTDASELSQSFELAQNYPNPFNPTTNIQFDLPVQSYSELTVYDMLGRQVTTLVQEELSAGTHTYEWDAANLSSGVYIYRLVTNQSVITKKMTLIK